MAHEYGTADYHREQVKDWEEILSVWIGHLRNDIRRDNTAEIARTVAHIATATASLKEHADRLLAATTEGAAA
jgi:hypothetical protein